MTNECAYGDYSCVPFADDTDLGSEYGDEEEIQVEDTYWYTNTSIVQFMYWTWGAAQVWSFMFGFMLYIWYP